MRAAFWPYSPPSAVRLSAAFFSILCLVLPFPHVTPFPPSDSSQGVPPAPRVSMQSPALSGRPDQRPEDQKSLSWEDRPAAPGACPHTEAEPTHRNTPVSFLCLTPAPLLSLPGTTAWRERSLPPGGDGCAQEVFEGSRRSGYLSLMSKQSCCLLLPSADLGRSQPPFGPECLSASPKAHLER